MRLIYQKKHRLLYGMYYTGLFSDADQHALNLENQFGFCEFVSVRSWCLNSGTSVYLALVICCK